MARSTLSTLTTAILAVTLGLTAGASAQQNRLGIAGDTRERPTLRVGPSHGAGQPDLIIEPRYNGNNGLPGSGFCGPWNGGNQRVYFYVRNIGSAPAPASDVQVNFGGQNFGTLAIPSLSPNQVTLRNTAIPLAAWGPTQYHGSVNFLIAADHNDDMTETSETNNYGQGKCIGPAS